MNFTYSSMIGGIAAIVAIVAAIVAMILARIAIRRVEAAEDRDAFVTGVRK